MISLLMLLVGAAAGAIFGFLFGQRQTATSCAVQLNAHQRRADVAEQTLADYRKSSAAQIDHAFTMAHRVAAEARSSMDTTRHVLSEAVELTKKAASLILPPEFDDEDLAHRSVGDSDRQRARERNQEKEREDRAR